LGRRNDQQQVASVAKLHIPVSTHRNAGIDFASFLEQVKNPLLKVSRLLERGICGRNVTGNGIVLPEDMTKFAERMLIVALLAVAIFFALRDAGAATWG
jgi:hypothetical protein